MDPTATLQSAAAKLVSNENEECFFLLAAYAKWRADGGFEPALVVINQPINRALRGDMQLCAILARLADRAHG